MRSSVKLILLSRIFIYVFFLVIDFDVYPKDITIFVL
nr:MAG TPA: hypothetical protein [Caudoviricetes sp.]